MAGDHLPDHRRLTQIGKELGQDLPDDDDRCERHEDAQQGIGGLGRCLGQLFADRGGRYYQRLAITANEQKGAHRAEDH
jgi:hypothetical protein